MIFNLPIVHVCKSHSKLPSLSYVNLICNQVQMYRQHYWQRFRFLHLGDYLLHYYYHYLLYTKVMNDPIWRKNEIKRKTFDLFSFSSKQRFSTWYFTCSSTVLVVLLGIKVVNERDCCTRDIFVSKWSNMRKRLNGEQVYFVVGLALTLIGQDQLF